MNVISIKSISQSPMVPVLKGEMSTVMSMCGKAYQWGEGPLPRAVMTPMSSVHSCLINFAIVSWTVACGRHSKLHSLLWLTCKFTALTTVHVVCPFLVYPYGDWWHQLPTVRPNITGCGHKHKKDTTSDTGDKCWVFSNDCIFTSYLQLRGSTLFYPVLNNLLSHKTHNKCSSCHHSFTNRKLYKLELVEGRDKIWEGS